MALQLAFYILDFGFAGGTGTRTFTLVVTLAGMIGYAVRVGYLFADSLQYLTYILFFVHAFMRLDGDYKSKLSIIPLPRCRGFCFITIFNGARALELHLCRKPIVSKVEVSFLRCV